jgi:hypothetical protein
MRLFRQTRPGDWAGVIRRVSHTLNLKQWTKQKSI